MEVDRENRVVVLIDMDCFYCQVEEKLNPDLKGKPIAVVQYNPWKGGGIIAVNYVARAMGVTRHMRGDEAKEKCPEIELPSVPCQRGKADITKYRDAGKEVAKVLQRFTPLLERASIDEAYLDITAAVQEKCKKLNMNTISEELMPNTFALGYNSLAEFISDVMRFGGDCMEFDCEHATMLLVGAIIVSEIRDAVFNETGYQCSAGIAHNKILAKLVCGMNKPNKQTVLPKHSINLLYKSLPIKKVKHLGGKFGDIVCQVLNVKCMVELQAFAERELQSRFDEKNGTWLYNIARGVDLEPVQARFNPKSIGCCKQLRGKSALTDLVSLKKWLKDLGDEIEDRLEKDALENNRSPKQMVVSYSILLSEGRDSSSSRSYNFAQDDDLCGEMFAAKSLELFLDSAEGCKPKDDESNRRLKAPITFLGISVGKFEDNENKKTKKILDYFCAGSSKAQIKINDQSNEEQKSKNAIINTGKNYVLQKFFQTTHKININASGNDNQAVVESTLDKQESFFAKFLNNDTIKESNDNKLEKIKSNTEEDEVNIDTKLEGRSTIPHEASDHDSNDTNYSTSTINAEINKSIALFDEDVDEINRVSDMRKLLHSSRINDEVCPESNVDTQLEQNGIEIETIRCEECGKEISLDTFNVHSDYHLALKLRDEERRQVRQEQIRVPQPIQAKQSKSVKADSSLSIAKFLVKIDDSAPSECCKQCGKRVPVHELAEHLDFHEAQKLNKELNRTVLQVHNNVTSSVKRKRKSTSPVKKQKVPCKSIDSFFR